MKDLPIVAKSVINIILYILYVVIAWVIFSFLFPLVMQVFGKDVIDPNANMALFDKIAIFIAILVLLVSLVLRKYFYVC
jgi:membrane-anchored glycerophosphoryl diester phosphodiesterase (GDPDase)